MTLGRDGLWNQADQGPNPMTYAEEKKLFTTLVKKKKSGKQTQFMGNIEISIGTTGLPRCH